MVTILKNLRQALLRVFSGSRRNDVSPVPQMAKTIRCFQCGRPAHLIQVTEMEPSAGGSRPYTLIGEYRCESGEDTCFADEYGINRGIYPVIPMVFPLS